MTKEDFEGLQLDLQKSGKPLMSYLHDAGISYSTYTYWRRKLERDESFMEKLKHIRRIAAIF